jgi:hypothetical protein
MEREALWGLAKIATETSRHRGKRTGGKAAIEVRKHHGAGTEKIRSAVHAASGRTARELFAGRCSRLAVDWARWRVAIIIFQLPS